MKKNTDTYEIKRERGNKRYLERIAEEKEAEQQIEEYEEENIDDINDEDNTGVSSRIF